MADGKLEEAYDREIAPLMQRVAEICKREHIPVFATFALDGAMSASTIVVEPSAVVPGDHKAFEAWQKAASLSQLILKGQIAIMEMGAIPSPSLMGGPVMPGPKGPVC